MGKRKTRETEDCFCNRAGDLFDHPSQKARIEKLRQDFYGTLVKQHKLAQLIRNEIPNANDSDSRNLLQELTDRLNHRLGQVEDLTCPFTDRKLSSYKKIRSSKEQNRVNNV